MPSFVLMFFCQKTLSTHKIPQVPTMSSLAKTRNLNFTNAGCNNKQRQKNIRMQITNIIIYRHPRNATFPVYNIT